MAATQEVRLTIDWKMVRGTLLAGAITGLGVTSRFVEAQAKKYAPVRAIFKRDRRMRVTSIAGMGSSDGSPNLTKQQYDRWRRARPKNHRIDVPENSFMQHGPVYGTNNSFAPVHRYTDQEGNQTTITGKNLRQYDPVRGAMPESGTEGYTDVRGPNKDLFFQGKVNTQSMLTAAGRAEAKSGRAAYAQRTAETKSGRIVRVGIVGRKALAAEVKAGTASSIRREEITLGGRLRGEIFATPPKSTGNLITAYVISPVSYSYYQEFGTRHNRAHPYLRPALYEGRRRLRADVAKAIRLEGQKVRVGSGIKGH